MTNYPIPRVQPMTASTEVPSGPPPVNWKEMDNFDPHWLVVFGYVAIACLIGRLFLKVFGLFGTCVSGWLIMEVASYGVAGFMINPIYCVLMAIIAGTLTYIGLAVLSEAVNAPSRIWWKITR